MVMLWFELMEISFLSQEQCSPVGYLAGSHASQQHKKTWAMKNLFYLSLRRLGDSQISVTTKHTHFTSLLYINIWKKKVYCKLYEKTTKV